jgi:hypothetical protein
VGKENRGQRQLLLHEKTDVQLRDSQKMGYRRWNRHFAGGQHQVREDTDIHLLPPLLQKVLVQMITAKGNLSLSCRSPRVSGTRQA